MPRLFRQAIVTLVLVLVFLSSASRLQAISSAEADASFDSFNTAFYVVSNGRGYYRTDTAGGRADFWKYAEMIEIIIDAYERTGRASYKTMISQSIDGFLYYNGSDWRGNMYNDDLMWMVIACCRGYAATGNTTYRDRAKFHFDAVYDRGWDTALGGGIWWTTEKGGKNACINGPAAIAACLLYDIYGDTNYLQKAKAIYAWERSRLFEAATGRVYDNISASGVVNSDWIFTYNQGTFLGAAHQLHRLTGLLQRRAQGRAPLPRRYEHRRDSAGIRRRWRRRRVHGDPGALAGAVCEGLQPAQHVLRLDGPERERRLDGAAGRQPLLVQVAQPDAHGHNYFFRLQQLRRLDAGRAHGLRPARIALPAGGADGSQLQPGYRRRKNGSATPGCRGVYHCVHGCRHRQYRQILVRGRL
jgi:hypothetical protein